MIVSDYQMPGMNGLEFLEKIKEGIDIDADVSSSLLNNPLNLKNKVVKEGLNNSGIQPGSLADEPLKAVQEMGDPVIPAFAGILSGTSSPILLAGGTQMLAVTAVAKKTGNLDPGKVAIGTTRWIIEDKSNNIKETANKLGTPVLNTSLNFKNTDLKGLKAYEQGLVKEGVGAGALSLLAEKKETTQKLQQKIEKTFKKITLIRSTRVFLSK